MHAVLTKDGSYTLFNPEFQEHYHSVYGAITESQHVFIEAGLKSMVEKSSVTLFEVGFGTGLNALLTAIYAVEFQIPIHYYAIDTTPLDSETVKNLNYPYLLPQYAYATEMFELLHNAEWDKNVKINNYFTLHKIHNTLVNYCPAFGFDLVYFDAFAPDRQPEMWTQNIFNTLYAGLGNNGVITTYCVKGEIRRMLKQAGFRIEKLPGPPGKREILRGRKVN